MNFWNPEIYEEMTVENNEIRTLIPRTTKATGEALNILARNGARSTRERARMVEIGSVRRMM